MYTLMGENFIRMIQSINPNAKRASGGREVVTRCMYCGDSMNPTHAHLYISVPTTDSELSFYHCKRCPAHGIVDDVFLQKMGCMDSNILVELTQHNTEVLKLPKYKTLKKIDIYPLKYDYVRQDPDNEFKLNYINNRIGSNFKIEDLAKLKIILNLYDVLNASQLELTRDKRITDALDKNFIGFISYDNSYCSLRKVTNAELYRTIDKRYIKYALVNKTNNSKDYYIIPTVVDITSSIPVKIHLAEGQFDILSIFYNLYHQNSVQNIYIACGGKSYSQALEFVLSETGIINYEVHYYPDNDVQKREFDGVINKIIGLNSVIYEHHNVAEGQKDYGVPMPQIRDSVRRVSW